MDTIANNVDAAKALLQINKPLLTPLLSNRALPSFLILSAESWSQFFCILVYVITLSLYT
uniref:Uncharacterized protein n=1 Tax=Daucus carota subsp. sativus TaxID=79200 RepID=A0A162AHI6_DAUCS